MPVLQSGWLKSFTSESFTKLKRLSWCFQCNHKKKASK